MKDEPPAKPRRRLSRLHWWLLTIFLGCAGYAAWRECDYRAAVREAKEAGFEWWTYGSFDVIRQNWKVALKWETWRTHESKLTIRNVPDLTPYRNLIQRLHPTILSAPGCKNVDSLNDLTTLQTLYLNDCPDLQNVNSLKGLTGLQVLYLTSCPALQNVDGLKGLNALRWLDLFDCGALQNADGLKRLVGLQWLSLSFCSALQNVDALMELTDLKSLELNYCSTIQNVDGLKKLTGLKSLDLSYCTALQNVDGLQSLSGLKTLYLYNCNKIPAASLRELRTALPKTEITFPDGTKNPPQ